MRALWLAALLATPSLAAPSITIDQTVTNADGSTTRVSGTLTITTTPAPTPIPTPLLISTVTVNPNTVWAGQSTTATVTLNRAPALAVQVAMLATDGGGLTLPTSLTIQPGQISGTVAVGTPATVPVDKYYSLAASYNGQSKGASLLVRVPVGAPSFSVSPLSLAPGASLTLTWASLTQPAASDWVGVYPVGGTGAYLDWRYLNGTAAGQLPLVIAATRAPGTYEARLFRQGGFTVVAKSAPFTVTATTPIPIPIPTPGFPKIEKVQTPEGAPAPWPLTAPVTLVATGTDFGSTPGLVWINGYPVTPSAWSETSVSIIASPDTTWLYPGWITLEREDGKAYSTKLKGDGREAAAPPLLSGFYNAAGLKVNGGAGGETLVIKGRGLGLQGLITGKSAGVFEVLSWTDTAIKVKVPPAWGKARVVGLEVTAFGGRKGYWPGFELRPPP